MCKLHLWIMVNENQRHKIGFFIKYEQSPSKILGSYNFFSRYPNVQLQTMPIEFSVKMQFTHRAKNGKTKNVKKIILMPLIFANYGRRLNIGKFAFLGGYVESLPGLFKFNRLSLSSLEFLQSRFKVAKIPQW